jgi:hypothetical protein
LTIGAIDIDSSIPIQPGGTAQVLGIQENLIAMSGSDTAQACVKATNNGADNTAAHWNEEAAELLVEVSRSQKEVQELLHDYQQDASELCTLKAAAEEEVRRTPTSRAPRRLNLACMLTPWPCT